MQIEFQRERKTLMSPEDPKRYLLKIKSISVEGLDSELSRKAATEIGQFLSLYTNVPLDFDGDVALTVLITNEMERHVTAIAEQYGSTAIPYDRQREGGMAACRILTAPKGVPFDATIILHSEYWSSEDDIPLPVRAYMFAYAFANVIQYAQGADSDDGASAPDLGTFACELRHTARNMMNVFDAADRASGFCSCWLGTADGTPVRMSNLIGYDCMETLHALALKISTFAAIDVPFYRITAIGLEELYGRIRPVLGQMLHTLMRALALFGYDNQTEVLLEALNKNPCFRDYVSPSISKIQEALQHEANQESYAALKDACNQILFRIGLRIEDLPKGMWHIHVHQPQLCPINEVRAFLGEEPLDPTLNSID